VPIRGIEMFDLKEIEKKIDALLESETAESLTKWLLNERMGEGFFEEIVISSGYFNNIKQFSIPISEERNSTNTYNYASAA
jgi:hypothetical protein